jgi:hypothetical protein
VDSSSASRIEKKLTKFLTEAQAGMREGSVVNAPDVVQTIDQPDVWAQLRRELDDVGISAAVVEENREYIASWVRDALEQNLLEERQPVGEFGQDDEDSKSDIAAAGSDNEEEPDSSNTIVTAPADTRPVINALEKVTTDTSNCGSSASVPGDSGYGSSSDSTRRPSAGTEPTEVDPMDTRFPLRAIVRRKSSETIRSAVTELAMASQEFEDELRKQQSERSLAEVLDPLSVTFQNPGFSRLQQRSTWGSSRRGSLLNPSNTGRPRRLAGSMLRKLMYSDTAIVQAASDGDIERVAKLLSVGKDVNARDRWGWSALSMCGYGGFKAIARLLLDHGADLDNIDVDGDTPMSLATQRGHADIVILFDEEREARDLAAREMDLEKPRP